MKIKFNILFLFFYFIIFLCGINNSLFAQPQHEGNLEFIENKNQWDENVLYKSEICGGAVFLGKNGFTFAFKDLKAVKKIQQYKTLPPDKREKLLPSDFIINHHAYKINFLNAKPDVNVVANEQKAGCYNYFIGNDKNKWASKVKSYRSVTYKELYAKTDLCIYENNFLMKYDFTLQPGADINNIKLQYEGVDVIAIREGNIYIKTSVNEVTELSPEAYQYKGKNKVQVECKYKLTGNILSFEFPKGYDKTKELIIDPTLIFSTYSGSTVDNWGFTATYDTYGNAYSGGVAFGTGFPVSTGAYQVNYGGGDVGSGYGCDISIIKYDSSGTQRLWATYLGGSANELPHSMIVNEQNELVLFGTTGSLNYPVTAGAYDQSFNGGDNITYDGAIIFSNGIDIFVSKLSEDGTQLVASTFVGGTKNDGMNYPSILSKNYADGARGEVMTDANSNVYIVSTTNSIDFPVTSGAFQTTAGGGDQDGCVFKLNANLSSMIWASYLGGNGNDATYGIVLDDNKNVYVTGGTASANFPVTSGALHTSYLGGNSDGYISEISANGNSILNSTYYGSDAYDQSYLIDIDNSNNIYVYGQTAATGTTMIYNATWNKPNGGQFVSKINSSLNSLAWSTTFGTGNGGPDISPTAFLVDICNKIYMTGWGGPNTNGFGGTAGLPITSDAFQSTTDNNDYYLLVINDDASSLIYATYFGSPNSNDHVDGGTSRFDRQGRIYQSVCAGCGSFDDFPTTPGAWSNTNNSTNCNNALFKFDFEMPMVIADFLPPDACISENNYFQNTSTVSNSADATYQWSFGDGATSALENPYHSYSLPGVYYVTLIVENTGACNSIDTVIKQVTVYSITLNACNDTTMCQGSVTLDANSSGTATNFIWSDTPDFTNILNNPTTDSSVVVSTNVSATYYIQALNQHCSKIDSVHVYIANVNVNIQPGITPTCKNMCNGQITLTVTGGTSPYDYQWSNGSHTQTLNNLCEGNYTITITDANHCTTSEIIQLASINPPLLILSMTPDTCSLCNGTATVSVSGGSPPYEYTWLPGMQSNSTITDLCSGEYIVRVSDSLDCSIIDTIDVTPVQSFDINVHSTPDVCFQGNGTATVIATGSSGYTYDWGAGSIQNTPVISGLHSGTYNVTVTDIKQCSEVISAVVGDSGDLNISLFAYPKVLTLIDDLPVHFIGSSADNVVNWQWDFGDGTTYSGASSEEHTYFSLGTFLITLIGTGNNGCKDTAYENIEVRDIFAFYIPNAFTPDGDGINDFFFPQGINVDPENFEMWIYNRWGNMIYHTDVWYDDEYKCEGWNGTEDNLGTWNDAIIDVYVYHINVREIFGPEYTYYGKVVLIK